MGPEEQLAQGSKGLGDGTERGDLVQPEKGSQPVVPAPPVPHPNHRNPEPNSLAAWVRAVSRQGKGGKSQLLAIMCASGGRTAPQPGYQSCHWILYISHHQEKINFEAP